MKSPVVRAAAPRDTPPIVALSLRAWRPVYESYELVWGQALFKRFYPDWPSHQATEVEKALADNPTWIVDVDGVVAGFVNVSFSDETLTGEIYMIAVDPDYQRQGLADLLTQHAIDQMRSRGMTLAIVSTGGDPGHAAARATYESNGFVEFPQVLYSRLI